MRRTTTVDLPSDDKRWKIVNATMRRNGYRRDALIETLHTVQEAFGFLDKEALLFVSRSLNIARSHVYGVATFYHFFSLRPQGEHVCSVCTGTACHIKGAKALIDHVGEKYDLHPEETTPGNEVSLLTVRCIGACGLAPAVVVDNEVLGNVTNEDIDKHFERFIEQ
jgi:bidirectional [NiFe] hydrogenase diaphorase subunit